MALADVLPTPPPPMKAAEYAWTGAIVLLLTYEAWALATKHTTLSRAVWMGTRSQYGPLIPFMAGGLAGHFFWSGQA
jgi:hypothetical protein